MRAPTLRAVPVPRGARERVLDRFPSGAKSRSEYRAAGATVAVMLWNDDGSPAWGWALRGGAKHGRSIEWYEGGGVSFVEPYAHGVPHGTARHYAPDGTLLLATRYARGTGVDLWCAGPRGELSEETRLERGALRYQREWNSDGRTAWREVVYAVGEGGQHSIEREWGGRGALRRGFPRFVVDGERVDRRAYLRRAKDDATLPRYAARDDRPARALPSEYIGQPAHQAQLRARRSHR